ncbi:MAG: hypothetical protein IJT41_05280 [Clostridia bacterium]|nr:hypothetical protein [Clostridia bacterium]
MQTTRMDFIRLHERHVMQFSGLRRSDVLISPTFLPLTVQLQFFPA